MTGYLDGRIDALREHLAALLAAVPSVPAELARVFDQIGQEAGARGVGMVLLLLFGFIGLGYILEALFRYSVAEKPALRWKAIAMRFAREAGALAVFTAGSAAVFLAFDWPVRTRGAVMTFLAALICVRAAIVVSRALLSPAEARLRVVPVDDRAARAAHARFVLFAAWLGIGWLIVERLAAHGMNVPARQVVAYALGLGLLALAMEALWRRSRAAALACIVPWALWVAGATGLFWAAAIALTLPFILKGIQASVDHVLRPEDTAAAGTRTVTAAALGRGLRALAIVGAAALLVYAFALNLDAMAASSTMSMRVLRGALQALAVILVADVIWLVAAAMIDQKLASRADDSRLVTLLPIMRGTVAAVLVVITLLMVLSALGVEVAPLLASAGVVGIAIGFGAQQLVRDLFAKYSYLLDDAFRVGEYIESGSYKGTVEQLGGRTVRLRHHRGPIFTIPYGQLGAVKNSSRDWVIDKMTIGVTYDTDLDKAKKIIKKIGQSLAEDAEFKDKILEPLKMQGVEQFGDYAIELRIKMKTKPNEQFTIRRRAYAMIKKAFAENGIHFAQPTVQVAGGAEASAAAVARQALDMKKAS
jgi:small-conductance mechanosensitive channel